MEDFRGFVAQIIYRNAENGYTVFELQHEGDEITCTGVIPAISEGESCHVTGDFVTHPVYDEQLKLSSYEACAPEGREAVLRYLSSGAIKGIGEALAIRIIKHFGDRTMQIVDEEPERLAEIKGISARKAREIAAQLEDKRDVRDAMLFLQQYGITNKQALKIWSTYGMEMYAVLRENPYRLAEDIDGIGFVRADEIASKIGVLQDSDYRVRSGLLYVLSQGVAEGNSYLPKDVLLQRAGMLLHIPEETLEIQMQNLAMDRKLVIKVSRGDDAQVQVYDAQAYHVEQNIARKLMELREVSWQGYTDDEIDTRIRHIEEHENIHLDDLQREAVRRAVKGGLLIMTGGPGTGKTTTINTIIRYFISDTKAMLLAAPTGRAAKRMSEATGYEAMTIHRLLGYKASGTEDGEVNQAESYQFERGGDNPLEADVVIIDEMSMVDIFLFHALLRAIKPGTRLILVGDTNQLPSVGPGRVLQDMVCSGKFPCVELQKIFRQATQSDIVMNAHRILREEPIELGTKSKDFLFLERAEAPVIYKHTVELLRDRLPKYLKCSQDEIQVLTPMRKGALGSIRLNEVLQSVLNPPAPGKREYKAHDTIFRIGDKVMQTRNNYQMPWEVQGNYGMAIDKGTGIFNGDFGVIRDIDERSSEMTICFDENRIVVYPFGNLEDLDLAYAITVHKSQGSEYPAVILPLLSGPPALFHRNLLYTAITRARQCVVILGSSKTVLQMAANVSESTRFTGLEERIEEMDGITG